MYIQLSYGAGAEMARLPRSARRRPEGCTAIMLAGGFTFTLITVLVAAFPGLVSPRHSLRYASEK